MTSRGPAGPAPRPPLRARAPRAGPGARRAAIRAGLWRRLACVAHGVALRGRACGVAFPARRWLDAQRPKMDATALLAAGAPAPRGPQLGGGPGRTRRTPGSAHRRLLLLRDPEDGAQEPRRGEARPAGPGGGDSFVVLLEVARGAAEAPGRRETEPEPGAAASPAGRPAQVPGAAPLVGPRAAGGQDLLVHLERGVLALAAPSRRPPPGQEAASPAGARRASAGPGYRCPEPQCALAFAKKHQLQVHLLTHGGGQGRRPFKCPLDGCGWAFTTSYKLKRHLQSHDKLRPFGCPVGGCGKKFTTVYNLRAHMKGHEQESLFKCEVCAERFPTHAKLSSHQRSHFEPERPYKCDFPGERRRRGGAGSGASLLPLGVAVAPEPHLAARLGQQLGESRRPSPAASGERGHRASSRRRELEAGLVT